MSHQTLNVPCGYALLSVFGTLIVCHVNAIIGRKRIPVYGRHYDTFMPCGATIHVYRHAQTPNARQTNVWMWQHSRLEFFHWFCLMFPVFPLLQCYVEKKRCAQPSQSIPVPPELARVLFVNGQSVDHGTARNGNCGVDAFGISLHAVSSKAKQLRATAVYKRFLATRKSSTSINHLRSVGHEWMENNGDVDVWSGMRFKDLALTMSSHEENYRQHLERMARDREWVDASFIHALGVVFHVDVQIWQEHMEPAIVGHSLMLSDSPTEPYALLNIAMVNDLHFWGVCPIPEPELRPPADKYHCKHSGSVCLRSLPLQTTETTHICRVFSIMVP